MTKQIKTSDIVAQKLEHINYFKQEGINDALYIGMARDACYTAHNGVGFKKKQLSDTLAEHDRHVEEKNTYYVERTERFATRLFSELAILEERLTIEMSVYEQITGGEVWSPKPVAKNVKKTDLSAMRKAVGA